jgi:hypothetical protein
MRVKKATEVFEKFAFVCVGVVGPELVDLCQAGTRRHCGAGQPDPFTELRCQVLKVDHDERVADGRRITESPGLAIAVSDGVLLPTFDHRSRAPQSSLSARLCGELCWIPGEQGEVVVHPGRG